MGKVLISPNYMTDIADAVRNKVGTANKFTPSELAEVILSMSNGVPLDTLASGYSSAKTYNVGDLVTYQDALYVCTTDISSSESFDSSHWSKTTIGDELEPYLHGGADDKYY